MIQLRGELRLVGEHRHELVVVGEMREDLLDRDDLLEALDAGEPRLRELGHSARRDALQDLVLPEAVRGGLRERSAGSAGRGLHRPGPGVATERPGV